MVSDDTELETIRKKKFEGMKDAGLKKEPEVLVYSSPDCPYCTLAKEYLAKKGVKFTEYDVSKDKEKAKEMAMKSQQTAIPVLQINGRIIVGFDRQLIDDSLKKAPPPKRDELLGNLFFDPFSI
jgi:glutaredoxin-like YruB-family protein